MDRPKTSNPRFVLAGLFLLSAASLGFEVLVTRIYSFLFVQSYVYIIISCSVAGIGFGAVAMDYIGRRNGGRFTRWLPVIPALLLIVLLGINSVQAMLVPSLAATFLVFAGVGVMQVKIFQNSGISTSTLYAADLIGASAGVLASYLAMNGIGMIPTAYLVVFLLSMGILIADMGFRRGSKGNRQALIAAVALILVLAVPGALGLGRGMRPNERWQKEMTLMLEAEDSTARITESRWTSFGRVDMVESDNPLFKTMFIDGGAGTKMIEMIDGQVRPAVAENLLLRYMGGVPLLIVEEQDRNRAAVVGSGGGIDVVTLLLAGYRSIDAIEINPDFIAVVKDHGDYNGNLYTDHPRVNLHNDEGRSFLREQSEPYDLILMGLPIIKSARSYTNHSLTENYLFTLEAFSEYIDALEPGGFLVVIAHYPNEVRRLFTNAVKSLERKYGIPESIAAQHIAVIGDDRNPTLVLKNGVFSPTEVAGLNTILTKLPVSGSANFVPFSGEGVGSVTFDAGMVAFSRDQINLEQFIAGYREDVSWVTDDSPFFYQLSTDLPMELKTVLIVAAVLLVLTILLYLRRERRLASGTSSRASISIFLCFGLIGIGFMLVEISIIQKFTVFWHHQTLALSVVLATILGAGGIGSFLSNRIRSIRAFLIVIGILVLLQLLTAFFVDEILVRASILPRAVKIPITVALLAPIFIPMGMPFPILMRHNRNINGTTSRYPWLIGFNSFTTLTGGVVALGLAMSFGYRHLLTTGMAAYVLMAVLLAFSAGEETSPSQPTGDVPAESV